MIMVHIELTRRHARNISSNHACCFDTSTTRRRLRVRNSYNLCNAMFAFGHTRFASVLFTSYILISSLQGDATRLSEDDKAIRLIPKLELHAHLHGSIRQSTLVEFALSTENYGTSHCLFEWLNKD